MRICVIQPYYSFDPADLQNCFDGLMEQLRKCDDSLDLIVLPDYSDVLADIHGEADFHSAIERYNSALMAEAADTAVRCNALVFVNAGHRTDTGWRNTTHVIGRDGEVIGRYYKAHPAPSEVRRGTDGGYGMDVSYSYSFDEPYTLDIEGVRYGFMTCYVFSREGRKCLVKIKIVAG